MKTKRVSTVVALVLCLMVWPAILLTGKDSGIVFPEGKEQTTATAGTAGLGALGDADGDWKVEGNDMSAIPTGVVSIPGDLHVGSGLFSVSGTEKVMVNGSVTGNNYAFVPWKPPTGGTMYVPRVTTIGYLGDPNCGVVGTATDKDQIGVYGEATKTGQDVTNYGGYFVAKGDTGEGVYGRAEGSSGCGVEGRATSTGDDVHYGGFFRADGAKGIGLQGEAPGAQAIGVRAKSGGIALYAEAMPGGVAGEFVGNVKIRSIADKSVVIELGEGLDYAEGFDVSEQSQRTAGAVLVIDAENPGKLTLSTKAYDTKVAGIVAGGKNLGSGVRLGGSEFDCNVALAGRVYCNVDASDAGIEAGDLLTTSAKPGCAIKVQDHARARGAILGKAMERLEKGKQGQILVLVTLQ